MAGLLEQLEVVQVGSHDFIVASHTVLLSDQVHQLVVDHGSARVEEGTARRVFKVSEQLLLLANQSMITLLSLLSEVEVLLHFLCRGEGNTVHSLQTVIGGLTEPVRG